ncbi:MAG: efflux RND transporter periplasmic adaptor subunit [Patescibacteria group bacterium]
MKFVNNNTKKILIGLAVIVVVGVGGFLGWQQMKASNQEVEPKYDVTKVTKGNVSVSLNLDGKTVIARRDLSFEIGGTVRGVLVQEGDTIKAWQTLAYLDTREAQKNFELALRDYSNNRNDFEEAIQVTYPGIPLTDTIKRILEKNQWNLEKAVLDVELKDLAKKKSYLSSPIAGIVAQVSIKPGETVSSQNQPVVVTIIDENSFHFETFAEDIEALKIEEGMTTRIALDALPDQSLLGTIEYVSPLATIDSNDLSTYKVIISFNNPEQKLLDGMFGEVEIISKESSDVMKVPNQVVKRENNQAIVYVIENEQLAKTSVELGFTNGKEVEIISGLKTGQSVASWK